MDPSRPRLIEVGLLVRLLAVPVAIFPLSTQPFSDLKLVLLVLGTLALWASGLPLSRRLSLPVLAWIAFAVLAPRLVRIPWARSSARGRDRAGVAPLLRRARAGRALTELHVDRARSLVVASAPVLAGVPLVWTFAPSVVERMNLGVSLSGSTIVNPVLLAIALAAAIPATVETAPDR